MRSAAPRFCVKWSRAPLKRSLSREGAPLGQCGRNPRLRPLHLVVRETEFCGLETGGRIQAQNAGEQSEFGSQTTLRLTNPPELRGFLSTRKPPRFVGTAWWGMQESN